MGNNPVIVEAALTHTKTRNMYGLVIISCHTEKKRVRVRFAKEWTREDNLSEIANDIRRIYRKTKWDCLHIDQITGQHLIESIKYKGVPAKVITTQKDVKDSKGIEYLEVMDKNEMIGLFMKFRQQKKIEFHPEPTEALGILESQMPFYLEHITEAGSVDYYAPGKEYDHLTKALLMCCFVVRNILEDEDDSIFVGGPLRGTRRQKRFMGMGDGRKDAAIVEALSKGSPGRIIHYY